MKIRKKINPGWLLLGLLIIVLGIYFALAMNQYQKAKPSIIHDSDRFYQLISNAFTISEKEAAELGASADLEKDGRLLAEEHWAAIAADIEPLFVDQYTAEAHRKAFEDFLYQMITHSFSLRSIQLKEDGGPFLNWNLQQEIKINCSYKLQYKFSSISFDEPSVSANNDYGYGEICWQKTNSGWKISKATWIVPHEAYAFTSEYY